MLRTNINTSIKTRRNIDKNGTECLTFVCLCNFWTKRYVKAERPREAKVQLCAHSKMKSEKAIGPWFMRRPRIGRASAYKSKSAVEVFFYLGTKCRYGC